MKNTTTLMTPAGASIFREAKGFEKRWRSLRGDAATRDERIKERNDLLKRARDVRSDEQIDRWQLIAIKALIGVGDD
jgi:hypothetical protein